MHRKVISKIINISNEPKHSDFALTKVDLVELFFIKIKIFFYFVIITEANKFFIYNIRWEGKFKFFFFFNLFYFEKEIFAII